MTLYLFITKGFLLVGRDPTAIVLIWLRDRSTRTVDFMALRSSFASDVILFPAKMTLTSTGKVESSPEGTFVNELFLKSIESTMAAAAVEMPEWMKLLI